MPEVELQSNSVGAEVEVKKLQELVRKLEQQNEQLRSRASSEESLQYFLAHTGGGQEAEDGRPPSLLDQLELLDLSSLSCWDESEETWLYASTKPRPPPHDTLPPLQWCRQVLDRPRSDVDAMAGPPSLRPETVVWGRGPLFCPSPFSPGPAPLQEWPLRTSCSTPQSSEKPRAPPLLCSPRHPTLQHALSPVRRELLPSLAGRTPTPIRSGGVPRRPLSPQGSVDGGLGSDVDDSVVQGFKLQDLLDVQVVARLQEESLRQDLVRASFAGRHSRSVGFQSGFLSSGSGLEEEDEDKDSERGFLLQRPRLLAGLLPHSQTFSSVRDFRASPPPRPRSASSTQLLGTGGWACRDPALGLRPKPELGSGLRLGTAGLQDFSPGLDALRRSLPNLARGPSTASVHVLAYPSSAPRLRNSRSFDSFAGLTPRQSSILLQNRVHGASVASLPSQLSKATAYVSPTIKGSWSSAPSTPRSSLPRPVTSAGTSSTPRNRVNQSARSFLTPPKTLTPLRSSQDISRRECGY